MKKIIDLIKKANRMDLTTGLVGRTLSEEDVLKALRGHKDPPKTSFRGSKIDREYRMTSQGKPWVTETTSPLKTTLNVSYKGISPHTESYRDAIVISIYTPEGKLEERRVDKFDEDGRLAFSATTTFNRPGSRFGERKVNYSEF